MAVIDRKEIVMESEVEGLAILHLLGSPHGGPIGAVQVSPGDALPGREGIFPGEFSMCLRETSAPAFTAEVAADVRRKAHARGGVEHISNEGHGAARSSALRMLQPCPGGSPGGVDSRQSELRRLALTGCIRLSESLVIAR